ncbi:YcaO-like family protein [Streptomyces aureoverticillatus]|uniref:YcaO-like family protein n=1 Tax=Streptomyces aureoverticillatus TaxID=66871 RepID=UPI001EF8486F|nr:YcaO-like family protein [Streptomyces aureoverticillatus]
MDGTVRARRAEETWAVLEPLLPRYGITRVADLTGLDVVGLPVWTAIRPAAQTLTATQGKGATDLLARISAVMEGIELWHAEQPMSPAEYAPAAELAPPYPLAALPVRLTGTALREAEKIRLEWTYGTGLVSARRMPVPLSLIRRQAQRPLWEPDLFRATSTGLACGNTRDEAVLHAMYEVVERDALFADELKNGAYRTLIDPATIRDPYGRELVDRLRAAQVELEVAVVDNAYGLPVFLAYVFSPDYPAVFAGAGCHSEPLIALARAITEAVQSRLTSIAGTRDDLPSHNDLFNTEPPHLTGAAGRCVPWTIWSVGAGTPWPMPLAARAAHVARRIAQVTGHEPIRCDLTTEDAPVTAVKVICPGARSRIRRAMPR